MGSSAAADWLSEQALAWSGLPIVTIRPTMFLESLFPLAAATVRDRDRIELPFGRGKTSRLRRNLLPMLPVRTPWEVA